MNLKNKTFLTIQIFAAVLSVAVLVIASILVAGLVIPQKSDQISVEYIIDDVILNNTDDFTISDIKPTIQGFSFVGWCLKGDDTIYTENMMLKSNKQDNIKLYAIYKSTINLNLQGGYGSSNLVALKDELMPNIAIPTRDGYSFCGYYSGVNGQGTQYYDANGTSQCLNNLPNGTSLYAYWQELN